MSNAFVGTGKMGYRATFRKRFWSENSDAPHLFDIKWLI
jgi:hypothetical protein